MNLRAQSLEVLGPEWCKCAVRHVFDDLGAREAGKSQRTCAGLPKLDPSLRRPT